MGSVAAMRRQTADVLLLTTVTIWALNFTVSKYIIEHGLRPLAYSSTRYAAAALLFAAITLPLERSLRISRADSGVVAGCIAILFLNQLGFIYALRFTTASTVALLFGTLPIFTALFATLAGTERPGRRFWLAAAVSFTGVALVAAGTGGDVSANLKGDALALLATATWAAYSVAIGPLMRRYSPFRLSAVFLLGVCVPLTLAGAGQLEAQEFSFGTLFWIAFVFAVIGPLVLTNVMWFTAIDRVGASRAALFANLQPFLAAIVAMILLSEPITALQAAGGVAIAAGILLATRSRDPSAPDRVE
ncbi:MAG: DMT family transporter [Actinomycetota bacterium]|nr:DMT family transporter [Actinomycetota bacterium]